MIRILQISEGLGLGGTQKVMQVISKFLDKEKFDVTICGYHEGGAREDILQSLKILYFICKSDYNVLADKIKELKIDLIHFHRSKADSYKIYDRLKDDFPNLKIIETNVFGEIYHSSEKENVDYRIFVSRFCMMRFARKYKLSYQEMLKNSGVFYNLLDMSEFTQFTDKQIQDYRKSLGIKEDEYVIGTLGRKDPYKFGNLCIDMMPYLIRQIPNIRYLIKGIPEEKKQLIKKRGLEKYFIYLEPEADMKQVSLFYQTIDLFVHTSFIGESFGNVYAEAMANAKAIVTNSTPEKDNAQIEVVKDNENGLIGVYPQDFADKVARLLKDTNLRKTFEKNNLQRIEEFKIENQVTYYHQLYQDVIDGNIGTYNLTSEIMQDYEVWYDTEIRRIHAYKDYLYEANKIWQRIKKKALSVF